MKTTIDSAGRLVIPKPIRESLGLKGGHVVEISEREGIVEIQPAPTPMKLVDRGAGPVAVPDKELPPLTVDEVREALEQARR